MPKASIRAVWGGWVATDPVRAACTRVQAPRIDIPCALLYNAFGCKEAARERGCLAPFLGVT
jgi:hypothetical protein